MRRLRVLDLILLGTLLPLWLACVWTSVVVGLRGGQLRLPLIARSAESAEAYPTVWATAWPAEVPTSAVRVGDEIRRANDRDLRGRSTLVATLFLMRAARASESRSPSITFARGGESFEVRVVPVPRKDWWSLLPFSLACVGAVTFVLLRRPDWRFARRFFVTGVWGGCGFLYFYGFEPASAAAFLFSQLVAVPLAMSLALDFAIGLARGSRPRARWQAALPWLWGIAYSGQFALVISWAPPFSLRGYFVLRAALITVYTVALLAALVRGYRASDAPQRRQLRWVVYGLVVGVTPLFVSYALPAFGIPPQAQRVAYFAGSIALAAIPLGILVAIVWFDLLDVDRLISATASYTILGIGGFAVLFAAAPALADVATGALGVSASGAQLAIGVLLAAVVVPTQRVLRRRLDRLFFADQHAVERGIGSLIDDLARAASLEEIVALTGERLLAVLCPESITVYAREGESFVPVFVRGAAAPSSFPATSPLPRALATRAAPLAAERWSRDARRAESPSNARPSRRSARRWWSRCARASRWQRSWRSAPSGPATSTPRPKARCSAPRPPASRSSSGASAKPRSGVKPTRCSRRCAGTCRAPSRLAWTAARRSPPENETSACSSSTSEATRVFPSASARRTSSRPSTATPSACRRGSASTADPSWNSTATACWRCSARRTRCPPRSAPRWRRRARSRARSGR